MNLGDKLLKLRKDNKMSQEEFAEALDVTRQTVSNWENYKSYPDINTIVKISDKFSVSLDILLKGDTKMINNIDKKVRNSKKYKKMLIAIGVILLFIIITFGIYAARYNSVKNELETKFNTSIKNNKFYKNIDNYYSFKYKDNIIISVPNQKMPSLFDFSMDFHNMVIDVDINYEDANYLQGRFMNYDDYNFTLINTKNVVIGSSSSLNKNDRKDISKLSNELNIDENELKDIINKVNELYKEFYKVD